MDDQLQALLDYTIFHIGMYITLSSALIALLKFAKVDTYRRFLGISLVAFTVAGAAGGLVGSAIPYHSKFDCFMQSPVGPWRTEWLTARTCTHIEHTAFWIGLMAAVAGALVTGLHSPADPEDSRTSS